jgi:site-specific recombinase XerC
MRIQQGKGRKDAELPTHERIWRHVKDRPAGLLVLGPHGRPIRAGDLSTRFGDYLVRRGLPHITPHQLRHRYGTALYQKTRDLLLVKELMRHEDVSTTQIYAQLADETRAAAIRELTL